MNKSEVFNALCELCSEVNTEVFDGNVGSDCLCESKHDAYLHDFRFDPLILGFIQSAVRVEIARYKMKVKENEIHTHLNHLMGR